MNLSLLLGVSLPADSAETSAGQGRSAKASQAFASAGQGETASVAAIDLVDAGALAGAFRSLVDQLMLTGGGQPADDDTPMAEASAPSEADDLAAALEAMDDADEPEWEDVPQTQQPQMWLVELEIINRTAGVQPDLPRPTVVPHNSGQTQDGPETSGEASDSLGTMPGVASLTLPEPAPAVLVAPQTVSVASDAPPQPTATDAPVDLNSQQPTEFTARPSVERATSQQRVETPVPTHHAADVETIGDSRPSQRKATVAALTARVMATLPQPAAHSDQPGPVEGNETATRPAVPGASLLAPGSGSGFKVQRAGVTTPEGVTQNPEPRTLNQNPEPGTQNPEPLQTFIARQSVPVEAAPDSIKTEGSSRPTAKADAPSGQPALEVRAGLVTAAINTKQSGDAPDRSHLPEWHLTISRPVVADQTLGTIASPSVAHELQSPHTAAASQPALIVAPVPANSSVVPEDTANQIVQAIKFQMVRGGGEVTIRLEPKHFGEVSITVRVEQGQVSARVQAESPVVREYLQTHQGLLRESLADQQLTLGKFEVAEPPGESRDGERRSAEERAFQGDRQSQQRRRQQSPNTPFEPFEVVA